MTGAVFLKQGDKLIPLAQQSYASEIVLQQLLENHPDLLAGEQMTDGAPRRLLLVSRELPIGTEQGGSNWYLDHLYLDQDAVPTLVEVKCSTDPRIRREVIGQMFDYAANAVARVTTADLQAKFDNTPDSTRRLDDFLQGASTPGQFWQQVGVNLAAGRIRMVFIADVIPPDLRRVVDFLASQLRTAEVFAVEVRKYENAGHEAFVPRLVSTPKSAPLTNTQRQWDEATFFAELATRPAPEAQIARDILNAMLPRLPKVFYGSRTTAGSCIPGRPLAKACASTNSQSGLMANSRCCSST